MYNVHFFSLLRTLLLVLPVGLVDSHAQTFIKRFGSASTDEGGCAVTTVPDGRIVVGGYRGDSAMIAMFSGAGEVQWMRTFRTASSHPDLVNHVSISDDGHIIGCGYSAGGDPVAFRGSFAFKADLSGNVVWIRCDDGDKPIFANALLSASANEYVLIQTTHSTSPPTFNDAVSQGLEPSSGTITWTSPGLDYVPDNSYIDDTYSAAVGSNGQYYTTGRIYMDGSDPGSMRPYISKFSQEGTHLWSKYHLVPSDGQARIYGSDIIYDHDSLTVCYLGDIAGQSSQFTIGLYRTDSSGTVAWSRHLNMPSYSSELCFKVLAMPYGYLLSGYAINGTRDMFVIAVSHQGELLWAKGYGDPLSNEDLRYVYGKHATMIDGDDVVVTGRRELNGNDDLLLIRMDEHGEVACGGLYDVTVIQTQAATFSANLAPEGQPITVGTIPISGFSTSTLSDDCSDPGQFLGPDLTACSSFELDATIPGASQYTWQDGSSSATLTITGPGTYWVTVVTDCCVLTDTIAITGNADPSIIGPQFICTGDTATFIMQAGPSAPQEIIWSTGDTVTSITLEVMEPFTLSAWGTDANGCPFMAQLSVEPMGADGSTSANVPNVFTPNEDGMNDLFHPALAAPSDLKELLVFNRWGQLVHASTEPTDKWDGTYMAKTVPDGTYFYVLRWLDRCSGATREQRGHVTLLR